jgi:hypothetical protein
VLQRTQELVAMVKKQITELVDIAGSVRLWLQFNIPPAGGQDFDAKVKARISYHSVPLLHRRSLSGMLTDRVAGGDRERAGARQRNRAVGHRHAQELPHLAQPSHRTDYQTSEC